jgi:hypothetical protein
VPSAPLPSGGRADAGAAMKNAAAATMAMHSASKVKRNGKRKAQRNDGAMPRRADDVIDDSRGKKKR